MAEDLADYFDLDVGIAEAATLAGLPVTGVFDAGARMHGMGLGGAGVVAAEPQFLLQTSQVPASVFGVTLVYESRSYTVREALPDGYGVTTLVLGNA